MQLLRFYQLMILVHCERRRVVLTDVADDLNAIQRSLYVLLIQRVMMKNMVSAAVCSYN